MRAALSGMAMLWLFAASPAQAALVFDIDVSNAFDGSGSIGFLTTSGDTVDLANVSAFSFSFTGGFPGLATETVTFGLGDIDFIQWSVDATTGDLSLNLTTATILSSPNGYEADLVLKTLSPFPILFVDCDNGFVQSTTSAAGCLGNGGPSADFRSQDAIVSFTPTPVPEPSSFALFALGVVALLGMGLWRRRENRIVATA